MWNTISVDLRVSVIHFPSWAFSQNCRSPLFAYETTVCLMYSTLKAHMSNSGLADWWQRIWKPLWDRKQAQVPPGCWWPRAEAGQGWVQPCWDTDALRATTTLISGATDSGYSAARTWVHMGSNSSSELLFLCFWIDTYKTLELGQLLLASFVFLCLTTRYLFKLRSSQNFVW